MHVPTLSAPFWEKKEGGEKAQYKNMHKGTYLVYYVNIECNWDAGLGLGLDLGSRQSRASRGKHFSNVKFWCTL